jgi:aspartyl-tRNA(Asn)/glutamyl-tRNA(Gln) amidotransferase subunit A
VTAVSTFAADPGSLTGLCAAIREGSLDPVGAVQRCFDRLDAVEERVQGFRVIDRDAAMARAERLRTQDLRGPLHGLPVAVKDVIDVAGLPTRAGSRTREHIATSASDATIVAQLRAAGAVILGKAHTTEFAYFDGPPPTRNPHDLARTPGGSSAGPAAVVAAGMVPLSVGTQTAGSVSRPAAYCGIAAFKPSTLSWPTFGLVPFAPSFDTAGVFGYRTGDATTAARVLMPAFLRTDESENDINAITIGLVEDPILQAATPAVRQSVGSTEEKLAVSGLCTKNWRPPIEFATIIAWHKTITEFELARAHGRLLEAGAGEVTSALCDAIARGRAIKDRAYHAALQALDAARTKFWAAAADFDALIFPAAPDIAPIGMKTGDPRFIIPFTSLGGPIASIPVEFDQSLPLGIMLIARPGRDWTLCDIADRLAPLIETPR